MKINLPVAAFFFLTLASQAQSKWDKSIAKAEAAYEIGSYKSASILLEKFKKKVNAKLGARNQYTPTIYFLQAKYELASGLPNDFETDLQNALNAGLTFYSENSEKYGTMMIDAAELYNLNGSYRLAKDYLGRAAKILDAGKFMTESIKARWDLIMAETLTGQGFYNESLALARSRETYFARRAIKQETVSDGKGGLKSRKIPPAELTQRFDDYARLLTLIGNTYGKQGKLTSSDSAFAYAETWIDKNPGDHTIAYVRNQLYNANMLVENGNENLPKNMEYDRTLLILKTFFKPSHYLGIQTYEEYLKELRRTDLNARYYNTKLEYEKMIDKEFSSKSIYQVRLKAVEFDTKLSRDKTKDLENGAVNVINNTASLPHNNILTTEILDFLVAFSVQEKRYANVENYLKDIVAIKTELYGAEAPEMHLAKLRLANFYIDYTNKISDAGKIYDESFSKIVEKEIGASHKDHLDILNHLAIYYELTDQYTLAVKTLQKASRVARSKYDDKDYKYGEELTRIARLQIRLGQYEEADKSITQSLAILEEFRKEGTKKGLLVEAIDTQATLFGIKGLFDEATDALNRSGKIIRKADGYLGIDDLSTAQNLSSLYIQLGLYSETRDMLDHLIAEYEKIYGAQSIRLIDPLVNKGKLLLAEGDYTGADKIALRANQLATSIYTEKSTKTAPTQKLLSDVDYTIGDYDNAETNIEKALASQEKQFGRNHIDVAKSLAQLALIKFYKGDDKKEVEKIMPG